MEEEGSIPLVPSSSSSSGAVCSEVAGHAIADGSFIASDGSWTLFQVYLL